MFGRRQVVQNLVIARRMKSFFRDLHGNDRADFETVARRYGRHLWSNPHRTLVDGDELSRARFHIGISTGDTGRNFANLTKRVALISDTLLLSHDWNGAFNELGVNSYLGTRTLRPPPASPWADWKSAVGKSVADSQEQQRENLRNNKTITYGMHCPDLNDLGKWILDAGPLLRAGLVWYLPCYSLSRHSVVDGVRRESLNEPEQLRAIDFLIKDGRAVDASGTAPVKGRLVRPVLRAELPFIQGVSLRDFGKITIGEFGAYVAFRDFLRQKVSKMDDSLDEVQSELALIELASDINDGVRGMRAEMGKVVRKRAVQATGAALGTVTTVLVAVYGPALVAALAALGASGGVWGVINAMAEHSTRSLRENKWYFVWALEKGRTTGTHRK